MFHRKDAKMRLVGAAAPAARLRLGFRKPENCRAGAPAPAAPISRRGMEPPPYRVLHSRAGLTLIEVLLALVILVIGVYTILKIFPAGFGLIEANRQRAMAASLANAELEHWKLLGENMYSLPEAIIAADYSGEMLYYPIDRRPVEDDYLNPGEAVPLWQPDSLWWPRVIIGERAIIPPLSGGESPLPFYVLAFAPIDYFRTGELVQVYDGNPFTRVPASPGLRQYRVDYATGDFTFASAADNRYFAITYSWVDGNGVIHTSIGEDLSLTAGDTTEPVSHYPVLEGSERVYLRFRDVSPSNPGESGEFSLDDSSMITGMIYFYSGDAGRQVKINYRAADWTILREDHEIPAGSTEAVRLNLGGIKGPDYRNPPRQPEPQPLSPDAEDDLGNGNYVVAVDLREGTIYADQDPPPTGFTFDDVDYLAGLVKFPSSAEARTVRIYYRLRGDWAVQLCQPAASYAAYPSAASVPWPWPYGYFVWDNRIKQSGESDDQYEARLRTLFFLGQEERGVVTVSYYDSLGNYHAGELHTLSAAGLASEVPEVEFALDSRGGPLADEALVSFIQIEAAPNPRSSVIAHGASLTARVLWTARGWSEVAASASISGRREPLNEVWREEQVTTFLTRPIR